METAGDLWSVRPFVYRSWFGVFMARTWCLTQEDNKPQRPYSLRTVLGRKWFSTPISKCFLECPTHTMLPMMEILCFSGQKWSELKKKLECIERNGQGEWPCGRKIKVKNICNGGKKSWTKTQDANVLFWSLPILPTPVNRCKTCECMWLC